LLKEEVERYAIPDWRKAYKYSACQARRAGRGRRAVAWLRNDKK
jgi:hypothetical protein